MTTPKDDDKDFFKDLVNRIRQQPDEPAPVQGCPFCDQSIKANHYFGQWVFADDCGCGGYVSSKRQSFLREWEQRIIARVGKRHARVRVKLHPVIEQIINGGLEDTCCAYLWGGTGSGKTQQLIEAERAIQARRIYAYEDYVFTAPNPQVFAPNVISMTEGAILDSLKPNAGSRQKTIEQYQTAPYLFIDDLGASKVSEWAYGQVFEIIDYRYRHEKITLISSNLKLGALGQGQGYNDRMTTRIFEMCGGYAAKEDGRLAVLEFQRNHRFGGEA